MGIISSFTMGYKQAVILLLCAYFLSEQASGAKMCPTPDNLLGFCVPIPQCDSLMKFIDGRKYLTNQEQTALMSYVCGTSRGATEVCCPSGEFNLDWAYNNCRTPNEEMGKCKPLDACEPMLNYLNRSNVDETRKTTLEQYACGGGTSGKPNVCCPNKPLAYTNFKMMRNVEKVPSVKKLVDHSKHNNVGLLPTGNNCGQQPSDAKIRNGNTTMIYEFPWAVALKIQKGNSFGYDCGGSLINNRYVLTAAHCIRYKDKQIVGLRLGEHDFTKDIDCEIASDGSEYCAPPHEDFDVSLSDVIVHPYYNSVSYKNDIALIRLRRPVNITDAIAPICLPIKATEKLSKNTKNFVIIGWGRVRLDKNSDVLMKARVPFQPLGKCAKINSANGQLCAGGVNQTDPCVGDSGGPLMADHAENGILSSIQYGIVSMGPSICGKQGYPTIYTRVEGYIDWILENLKP